MSIESMVDKLTTLIGALASGVAAIASYMNLRKIREVHVQINSRMDQLLKATGLLRKAEGKAEGRAEIKEEQKIDPPPPI